MKVLKRVIPLLLLAAMLISPLVATAHSTLPFTDVPDGAWYEEALVYCFKNKIVSGTSPVTFSPNAPTSRAAVVMMLWNLEKNPEPKKSWYFADGGDRNPQWYTKALNWGMEAGILYGEVRKNEYGVEYRFADPERNVTRAELIAFLYRYTVLQKKADDKSDIYFASIFADYKKDNNWVVHEKPIAWATEARIMTGIEAEDASGKIGMYFMPGKSASRAETVQLFKNILTAKLTGADGHIHHFNGYVTAGAVASTCTVRGHFTYRCNACSETRIVTRALLAHDYYLVASTKSTCTQNGKETYVCKVCGNTKTVTLHKLGHNYKLIETKAATYRATGYNKYKCTACGNIKTDVIAKLTPTVYERVINRTYKIPANYINNFSLAYVENGQYMEAHAAEAMKKMVAAMRAAGLSIVVQSGYRSDATQTYLYNNYVSIYGNKYKAGTISAVPYSSEHQSGLAMDLSTDGQLEQWFGATAQCKWLIAHCAEYGYILRYTQGKQRYTGIIYEPWHFRYVGSPAVAKDIMASGLCMEEYYGMYLAPADIDPYLPYL